MSRRQDDRFTYPRQLIFEACGKIHSAAEVMNYLLNCFSLRLKSHPNDPLDSERFTFRYSAARLAANTFYSTRTIERSLVILKKRGLITTAIPEKTINRTNKIRINFVTLEKWKAHESEHPLFPDPPTPCRGEIRRHVGVHTDTTSECTPTPCRSAYSILNTASNTSSSKPAAAAVEVSPEEKPVIEQLVKEAGFTEALAVAQVAQHGRQLAELAIGELKSRKSRPSDTVAFVRGFIANPGNYNASRGEHGWVIGRKESTPRPDKLLLAAQKELAHARANGTSEKFYLDYGMIPREYKLKALELEKV